MAVPQWEDSWGEDVVFCFGSGEQPPSPCDAVSRVGENNGRADLDILLVY